MCIFLLPFQHRVFQGRQKPGKEQSPEEGMDETKQIDYKEPSLYFIADSLYKWDILQNLTQSDISQIEKWHLAQYYLKLFTGENKRMFGPLMEEWFNDSWE